MRKKVQHLRRRSSEFRQFVSEDVWRIGRPGEERPDGFVAKQVRVVVLLFTNLLRGTVLIRASALAFATIFALVPFFAIIFYLIHVLALDEAIFAMVQNRVENTIEVATDIVAREQAEEEVAAALPHVTETEAGEAAAAKAVEETTGIDVPEVTAETPASPDTPVEVVVEETLDAVREGVGAEEIRESEQEFQRLLREIIFRDITHEEEGMIDPVKELFSTAQDLVAKIATNPGALLISLVLFVLTTVFGLFQNIEFTFNFIWGVSKGRPLYRMFGDYVLIIVLLPFAAAAVLGVQAAMQSPALAEDMGRLSIVLRVSQYLIICLGFTALYYFVPNTHVRLRSALLGGLVAGGMWVLLSWMYVSFQVGLANYSKLYTTLAQLPMLLMWIYLSWVILLFGVELSYAYQNERTFALDRYADRASFAYRETLGIRLMLDIARRFEEGSAGLAAEEAAQRLNVPVRLVNASLETLTNAGFVAPAATEPITYIPARSLDKLRLDAVVTAIREQGRDPSLLREDEAYRAVLDELSPARSALCETTIADLIRPETARPEAVASETAATTAANDS